MLDIRWIRAHAELVQQTADGKGISLSVAELLAWDDRRRALLMEAEALRRERNRGSAEIAEALRQVGGKPGARAGRDEGGRPEAAVRRTGQRTEEEAANWTTAQRKDEESGAAPRRGEEHAPRKAGALQRGEKHEAGEDEAILRQARLRMAGVNERLAGIEAALAEAEAETNRLLLLAPNPVSADTPQGRSDADNIELRRIGTPREFAFEPLDHLTLGERLGLIDVDRAAKLAGSRQVVLRGAGVLLHRAVQQLALDRLLARGFEPVELPLAVRAEALRHTGFFPLGEEQTYKLEGEDRYLIGTSEVGLVSLFSDEVIELTEPVRLAAASACFRREAGAAGRDTKGLYRVHQFAKVEQVVLCRADAELAERLLQELLRNAEEILQLLELPYRVVAVCIGDMSQKTHKQYDIETWMPGRGAYGETHSASNLLDFQARRAGIRYRDEQGQLRFAYTLNNTAVATPRILIPLLEHHQREDGAVTIPQALRPYMGGLEAILPEE